MDNKDEILLDEDHNNGNIVLSKKYLEKISRDKRDNKLRKKHSYKHNFIFILELMMMGVLSIIISLLLLAPVLFFGIKFLVKIIQ